LIKAETILDYSVKENIAERFAKRLGAETGQSIVFRLFGSNRTGLD
jgi:protease-4